MPTTKAAPEGARWAYEEVKTDKGTKSLGNDNPILVWEDLDKARAYYGDEKVLGVLDGTSLRVSFQNIIRRGRAGDKSVDDIAQAQLDFKPGTRQVGESTPASRVARAAKAAVADGGANEDQVMKLLEALKSGKLSGADIDALTS